MVPGTLVFDEWGGRVQEPVIAICFVSSSLDARTDATMAFRRSGGTRRNVATTLGAAVTVPGSTNIGAAIPNIGAAIPMGSGSTSAMVSVLSVKRCRPDPSQAVQDGKYEVPSFDV